MKQLESLGRRLPVWFTLCLVACFFASKSMAASPAEPDLLEAEQAFRVSAKWRDAATVEVRYAIADGYYMYRDRFAFAVNGKPMTHAALRMPKGHWKHDVSFGRVVTYRKSVRILLPVAPSDKADSDSGDVAIALTSQGCADIGVCYPPLRQTIRLARGAKTAAEPGEAAVTRFSREESSRQSGGTLFDLVKKREKDD